jgi:hypothetical protein
MVVGGTEHDTVLFRPGPSTVANGSLYVFDYGDSRLKAFDSSGKLAWSFGRSGGGPGEFMNVADLAVSQRALCGWSIRALAERRW